MIHKLEFQKEGHLYKYDGKPVDGLTSTIEEAGLIGSWGNAWYLDRGSKIHLATQYHDEGTLDESTVDPQIWPYLNSWVRFLYEQDYKPIEIEYKIYHPELKVGMTIDRLPGPVDLKSGAPEPWHILQIAVQWSALICNGLHDLARKPMDVYLDPDGGPPKVKLYKTSEMREAFKVYCSMLYFLRWRREKYGSTT